MQSIYSVYCIPVFLIVLYILVFLCENVLYFLIFIDTFNYCDTVLKYVI